MNEPVAIRIGDLVELPHVRTVVQLADLKDPELAGALLADFILTEDSDFALKTVFHSLADREGQGFFLQGNFGSGKSHLLAVMDLLLRSDAAWEPIVRQATHYESVRRRVSPSTGDNVIAAISLVEHTGSSSLEDVCLAALESALAEPLGIASSFAADPRAVEEIRAALKSRHQGELRAFCEERSIDPSRLFDPSHPHLLDELVRRLNLPFRVRRERAGFFDTLAARLGGEGGHRAVLIFDELSEFLRSKPDARAFNEDIRFLQFLGEASRRMPLWIIASLQEHIETTGEIDQVTFGKIKDRYPVRLSLTGRHLRELAASRLIKKKPGAEATISRLYRRYKSAFVNFEVSESDFVALYPVHPATLELLDDLLPLFSRHRGAVDFLHHQLAGDPQRRIPSMLDLPAETLLGPEAILDHFRVRIHETLETAPYITVVLGFFEKELARIFPETDDRQTALRLVKILILGAISPIERQQTVARLADMLLYRLTEVDPTANYDYVRDQLETLRTQGAYLAVKRAEHPHRDAYFVDLTADVQLIIQRRVEGLLKDPGFTLGRALDSLLPGLRSSLLPLASLAEAPRSTRRISWQKTRRDGVLLFCRGEEDPLLSDTSLDEMSENLASSELDFCVLLMAPHGETAEPTGLLARLRDRGPESYLIWLPRPLGEEAIAMIRRAAARLVVRDVFRDEGTEVGKRVVSALAPLIQEDRELVENLVQRAYREGKFIGPLESPKRSPAELPPLPFDRILERVAELALERRFPRHYLVAPTMDLPTTEGVQEMVRGFFRVGELEIRDVSEPLRATLEAHLRPLGLVKRTATGYRLQPDPKASDLVRFILDRIGAGRVGYDALYQELRKGPFGLARVHFELTVLALVFSGQLTAFSKGRKMALEMLDARALGRVDHLGPGEMVSPELQEVLSALPFVPARFRKGAFGYAQQRELWEHVTTWKSETAKRAADISAELDRARSYRSAAHLDLDGLSERVERLRKILDQVKTSYPAREGLERLALACREESDVVRLFEEFDVLSSFFSEEWQRYLFIQKYMSDPGLGFPDGFADLSARRDEVRELASRSDAPLSPDLLRRLRESFQEFLLAYGQAYERDHNRQKSPQRIEPLARLREGRAFRLLQRLAELRLISVEDDRVQIDRWIDGAMARVCNRLSPEDLRSKPVCECGFRLGHQIEPPSLAKVQEAIDRGIRQYLVALREAPYREKIEGFLFGLSEVGKASLADKTRQLLALDLEDPRCLERAEKLVDAQVVEAVNAALAGDFVLVDRALEDLAERLVERSFPKAKLMELVERWVDGEARLGAEDYVRVVSRSSGKTQLENRLRDFVAGRYPEILPRWEQVGEAAILREAVFAYRGAPGHVVGTTDPETRILSLLGEAFAEFVREHPQAAAQALDIAERALSVEARERVLECFRKDDDPATLLERAFRERCFRFVVREASTRLLRMLSTDTLADRLVEALGKVQRLDLPAPLPERVGLTALETALENAVRVRGLTVLLRNLPPDALDAAAAWEKLFREHLGLADLAESELRDALKLLGDAGRVEIRPLIAAYHKELHRVAESFERFYLDLLPREEMERGGKGPYRMEHVFVALRQKYEDKLRPVDVRLILLDGMRWDVWHFLKRRLLPDLTATYRVVDEVLLWSSYPTTTKVQLDRAGMAPFEEIGRAAEEGPRFQVSPSTARTRQTRDDLLPGFQLLIGPGGERVDRLNLVDEKVHESKADPLDLLREIELHCRRTLGVWMEEVSPGSMVLIFSDHGFREDRRWKPGARYKRARYHHGGASPWEVLTPLVVLYRA